MKMRGSLLICMMLVLSLFATACSGNKGATESNTPTPQASEGATHSPEPSSSKQEEQVLNLTAGQEISTMNSIGLIDNPSIIVLNNVMEGLYRLGKDNKPIPGMAESYEVSSDGLVYTFQLRKDAKWSNGTPVTAHDFEYAWRRALDPNTMSSYANFFDDIVNGLEIRQKQKSPSELGIKVIDDHKFEVTLSKPVPYFLDLLTTPVFYPQNQAFVESQGDKYALESDTLIYNGPFVLDEWKHDESYVFKKNPTYWDADSVKLERINFKVVKDVGARMNLFEAGQIDITALSSEYVEQYKDSPAYVGYLDPEMRYSYINLSNPYLQNKNIRKAITSGWNKQDLTDVVLNNGSVPANYLVPRDFVFGPDGSDFRAKYDSFNNYSIEEAQKFWEQGLQELGVSSITLELLNYEGELSKTIGQYLKNQLEKNLPGLTININQQPQKQKLELTESLKYDIAYAGWGPDYPDPLTFLENFATDAPFNWSAYSNSVYDELIAKAKNNVDLAARWKDLQEAERVLFEDDVVLFPMYQSGAALLVNPYVKDYVTHPFGVYTSYKWAYIEGKNAK